MVSTLRLSSRRSNARDSSAPENQRREELLLPAPSLFGETPGIHPFLRFLHLCLSTEALNRPPSVHKVFPCEPPSFGRVAWHHFFSRAPVKGNGRGRDAAVSALLLF